MLPHMPRPRLRVCILGDPCHCEQARRLGIPYLTVDDLKRLNKNKKRAKLLWRRFDCFLVSQVLLPQIPRLMDPGLSKAGRFPTLIQHGDDMELKVLSMKHLVKFQMKKVL